LADSLIHSQVLNRKLFKTCECIKESTTLLVKPWEGIKQFTNPSSNE
jgi:hypothetical protein